MIRAKAFRVRLDGDRLALLLTLEPEYAVIDNEEIALRLAVTDVEALQVELSRRLPELQRRTMVACPCCGGDGMHCGDGPCSTCTGSGKVTQAVADHWKRPAR